MLQQQQNVMALSLWRYCQYRFTGSHRHHVSFDNSWESRRAKVRNNVLYIPSSTKHGDPLWLNYGTCISLTWIRKVNP